MHGQWGNPVYAEPKGGAPQVIFPGGDGWLYSFAPRTGDLLWKFDCNPKASVYELGEKGTRSDLVCTPVVWEDKLYIGVGQDPEHKKGVGHLWCIDLTKKPTNKELDLSPVNDNFDPKAEVNKDSGFIWHYGGFLDPLPNKYRKWKFGRTLSTVAINDGLLYTSELDGIVHCLDARTGKPYWTHDMNADTWGSPFWVNGHVYIGNEKGKVLVFKHGKEKKLVNTIDMNCGYIRRTPVVVNGVLYLITENPTHLWAITEKGGT
jgi:outer membrane protein assembly factor BamB